jgi:hypothetical protein
VLPSSAVQVRAGVDRAEVVLVRISTLSASSRPATGHGPQRRPLLVGHGDRDVVPRRMEE